MKFKMTMHKDKFGMLFYKPCDGSRLKIDLWIYMTYTPMISILHGFTVWSLDAFPPHFEPIFYIDDYIACAVGDLSV